MKTDRQQNKDSKKIKGGQPRTFCGYDKWFHGKAVSADNMEKMKCLYYSSGVVPVPLVRSPQRTQYLFLPARRERRTRHSPKSTKGAGSTHYSSGEATSILIFPELSGTLFAHIGQNDTTAFLTRGSLVSTVRTSSLSFPFIALRNSS